MIFGIGTDIVRVARMDEALARHGSRFAHRILTEEEYREFCLAGRPAHFLAKRFAAKEAAAKAMGTGFRDGMSLRHIGVAHDDKGRPSLVYHGRAEQLRRDLGIGEGRLSLADERDYAVAFVILLVISPA
ncbi:MAG: holo-ACP synthase [Pseudomonadota bacterium]